MKASNAKGILLVAAACAAATIVIAACNRGPIFYAELEEPQLCKTLPDVPFTATDPGQDLTYQLPIPIGVLPLFAFDPDAGTLETEVRLIEFRLLAKEGITDFNSFDTAQVTVKAPPGSTLSDQTLVTYSRDPNHLPGTTMIVAGDRGVNLVPYLFDASDAGSSAPVDGGLDRSVLVEGTMTGSLPPNDWKADVRVCVYMRTRLNYLSQYGY